MTQTATTALSYAGLLVLSNIFMTFAWYYHLKGLSGRPVLIAILVSWGIAFFEYCITIPAARFGNTSLSLEQMKITQEIVTLAVFAPFAVLIMKERISWNFLYASLCMIAAAYFIFKK